MGRVIRGRNTGSLIIGLLCAGRAIAGPPLSIDDPGILEPGHAEFIVAGTVETTDAGSSYLLPILDVSYGISPDIQLAAVATRAINNPDGGSTKSDFGPGAIGVKWRFMDREALQMSVAPYYEFLLREGAADRGVSDDVEAWTLPVQFQYDFSSWRLNAEVRYSAIRGDRDEWGYGVAAAYPLTERVEALVELHGGADRKFDDNGLMYRLGTDVTVTETFHVLASAGWSIEESGDDDVNFQAFLGLQWFR